MSLCFRGEAFGGGLEGAVGYFGLDTFRMELTLAMFLHIAFPGVKTLNHHSPILSIDKSVEIAVK